MHILSAWNILNFFALCLFHLLYYNNFWMWFLFEWWRYNGFVHLLLRFIRYCVYYFFCRFFSSSFAKLLLFLVVFLRIFVVLKIIHVTLCDILKYFCVFNETFLFSFLTSYLHLLLMLMFFSVLKKLLPRKKCGKMHCLALFTILGFTKWLRWVKLTNQRYFLARFSLLYSFFYFLNRHNNRRKQDNALNNIF